MRRPAPPRKDSLRKPGVRKAEAARRERRDKICFLAGLWALIGGLWPGIDTTSAITLRNRVADMPRLAVGAGTVIRTIGLVECLALASRVRGPLFPQSRRVALSEGVVVEAARCRAPRSGNRSRESTVRVG